MRNRRIAWVASVTLLLAAACGRPDPPARPRVMDLSTPERAVESLISAASREDVEDLARCIAPNAEPSLQRVRQKQLTKAELARWRQFRGTARVGKLWFEQRELADVGLIIDVHLSGLDTLTSASETTRSDTVHLIRTPEGWKAFNIGL